MTTPTPDSLSTIADELEQYCETSDDCCYGTLSTQLVRGYIERLRAHDANDKDRLDWLENKARCYWVEVQRQPDGEMIFAGQGPGLPEAIDAARAKGGKL